MKRGKKAPKKKRASSSGVLKKKACRRPRKRTDRPYHRPPEVAALDRAFVDVLRQVLGLEALYFRGFPKDIERFGRRVYEVGLPSNRPRNKHPGQ